MELAFNKNTRFLVSLFCLLTFLFSIQNARSYDPIKRLSLFKDKLKMNKLSDSKSRDFYFETGGVLNTSVLDLAKSVETLGESIAELQEKIDATSDSFKPILQGEQLNEIEKFLENNDGTEQGGGGHIEVGFPLPNFKLFGVKFSPNLEYNGNYLVKVGFVNEVFYFYNYLETGLGSKLRFRHKKRYIGFLKFHSTFKTDLKIEKNAADYQSDPPNINAAGQNLHGDLALDFGIGYRRRRWNVNYIMENLKLMQLVAPKNNDFAYGNKPLMALHGAYKWKHKGYSIKVLAGAHQRTGHYRWGEAYYLGSELGAIALKGKLGLSTKFTMDPEHWNVGLKAKVLIGQLDYLLKLPKKSSIDGVDISSSHSLSLRLFF